MTCPKCAAPLIAGVVFCEACGASVTTRKLQESLIGKVLLNQYVVREKIGEGGYGEVYLAEQPSMGRKVAIKTLHRHMAHSPDTIARFAREGMVTSRLEHPNAVKMLNLGETEDGTLWLAMEFLEGKTLDAFLKEKGTLSPLELLEVLGPVSEVLAEAHEKGVIHRDLKPENIMLTSRGGKLIPRVMDFGIAGILGDTNGPTVTGMLTGTPRYMPPEQWKGLKFTDARSDIYALGIITYQCLSGKLPFEAEATPGWMVQHLNTAPKPLFSAIDPGDLPVGVQDVVMRSMAKSPDDRYQTAAEFYAALREALFPSSATLSDASLKTISQPRRPDNKRGQKVAGAAAAGLLAVGSMYLALRAPDAHLPAPTPQSSPAPLPSPARELTQWASSNPATEPSGALTREERAAKAIQLYEQATQLYAAKDYLEAQRLVEQANALNSGFPELVRLQGLLYLANSQYEKACVHFQQYLQLVPGSIYTRDIVMTMQVQNPKLAPSCTVNE